MEDNITEGTGLAEQYEEVQKPIIPAQVAEKREFRGEYSGDKIKDIADKAGLIGGISSIVIGFLIWSRSDDLTGFLIGLLVLSIGIFASYVLASVLYSYGDVVTNSFLQTIILKRLEEQKLAELPNRGPDEISDRQAADAAAVEPAQKAGAAPTEPDDEIDDLQKPELNTAEAKRLALARKLKLPLHGVIDARMRRVAHFAERSRHGIICPVCGRKQDSERNNCFFCDCRFIYDDESVMDGDDNLLDRLRRLQSK